MPSSSAIALRRTVVELADLDGDDLRAVLAGLDGWERNRIHSLLEEFDDIKSSPATRTPEEELLQSSPDWLAARTLPDPTSEEARRLLESMPSGRSAALRALRSNLQITPTAVATLKRLALAAKQDSFPTSSHG